MKRAKQIIDIVFKCIDKLSDEEIERLINKESKLVCVDVKKKINKNNVDSNEILDICNKINNASTREEAYNLLNNKIKKDKLYDIAKYFNIHVLKSYNKQKIIHNIVEGVVGIKIDKNLFMDIEIK